MMFVPGAGPAGARERSLEGALRECEHQLRARFEQSTLPIIEWDLTLCVMAWNPAAERLFGYTSAEVLGRPVSFLAPDDGRGRSDAAWRELAETLPSEFTQENVTKSGQTLLCEWHTTRLTAANGAARCLSSTVLDVTARARLQRAVLHSRRVSALAELADGVAHEFTNVFAVILSYANFIKEDSPAGDRRREDALQILLAAGTGTALIRQLLGVMQHATEEKAIDLNESLAQAQVLLVRAIGEQCQLAIIRSTSPAVVRIDPVQFDQLALSLARNASEAMPDGGQVTISLECLAPPSGLGSRIVRMTVTDTGRGMSERVRQLAFEPSFTTKEDGDVAGLGLATCLSIVESAGGTLGIHSAEALGTSLVVDLPVYVGASNQDCVELEPAGHGERVLIVESEPGLRRALARAFEAAGYEVLVAADRGETLLQIARAGEGLHVVVADLSTPGCSGYEVAERVLRVAPRAVVMVTCVFVEDGKSEPLPAGVRRLCKPLLPTEIVRAVSRALLQRAPPSPASDAAGEIVLVVEDDDGVRAALTRVLELSGYSAHMAPTLASAREYLENRPEPDLVLCDLSLPDGSSVELLNWIQRTRPALSERVFILSGGAVDQADAAFAESGAFPLLKKPIEPAPLLEVLDRARGSKAGSSGSAAR